MRGRHCSMQRANLLSAGESAWWGNIRASGCRHTWCSIAEATYLGTVVSHEWLPALAPACLPGRGGQKSQQQHLDINQCKTLRHLALGSKAPALQSQLLNDVQRRHTIVNDDAPQAQAQTNGHLLIIFKKILQCLLSYVLSASGAIT